MKLNSFLLLFMLPVGFALLAPQHSLASVYGACRYGVSEFGKCLSGTTATGTGTSTSSGSDTGSITQTTDITSSATPVPEPTLAPSITSPVTATAPAPPATSHLPLIIFSSTAIVLSLSIFGWLFYRRHQSAALNSNNPPTI